MPNIEKGIDSEDADSQLWLENNNMVYVLVLE